MFDKLLSRFNKAEEARRMALKPDEKQAPTPDPKRLKGMDDKTQLETWSKEDKTGESFAGLKEFTYQGEDGKLINGEKIEEHPQPHVKLVVDNTKPDHDKKIQQIEETAEMPAIEAANSEAEVVDETELRMQNELSEAKAEVAEAQARFEAAQAKFVAKQRDLEDYQATKDHIDKIAA